MKLDVAITGTGVCAPLGHSADELLAALLAGRSGVAPVTAFDPSPFPCRVAARVTAFKARDWVSNRKNLKLMSDAVRFGLAAVKRAHAQAGLPEVPTDPERLGMFVGAGTAFGDTTDLAPALERGFADGRPFDAAAFATEGMHLINPLWLLKGLSNNVLGFATADLDARGINQNYCNSAAGGLQAVGEAAWAIAEGKADLMIAGGADSAVDPAHFTGFGRLQMLTEAADADGVRPFDEAHDGFAPGEGAAFFVLETPEHARARGQRILARIVGYGTACSAHELPTGVPDGIARAAQVALGRAGWDPREVDVVYAHGNGTAAYDRNEAAAWHMVFGDTTPPITTNKANIGHAIAASGPLSLACAVAIGARGAIPHVRNLETVARDCRGLDLVVGAPRAVPVRRALVHCAGLGAQTAVIALEFDP